MAARIKLFFVVPAILALLLSACSPVPTSPVPTSQNTESPQPSVNLQPTDGLQPADGPQPDWVGEFSAPILLALQDRPPDFQDDFTTNSDQWSFDVTPDRGSGTMEIANGVLRMGVEPGQMGVLKNDNIGFTNFVLRVDAQFQASPLNEFQIFWGQAGEAYDNRVFALGDVGGWRLTECGSHDCNDLTSGPSPISLSDPVTIMIVSKGTEFGIYLNGIPLTYHNNPSVPGKPGIGLLLWAGESTENSKISLDNLSIWDLDTIFTPPTEVPQPTVIPTPAPWISDFGAPILQAIQGRAPDYQDDFSQGSSGWNPSPGGTVNIANGILALSGGAGQGVDFVKVPRSSFTNFVVQVELNTGKLVAGCEATIQWRGGADGPGRIFGLQKNKWGFYSIYQTLGDFTFAEGMPSDGVLPLSASGVRTITLISKDPEIGVYLDGLPLSHVVDALRPPDPGFNLGLWYPEFCVAEFDNLKVWNLDK